MQLEDMKFKISFWYYAVPITFKYRGASTVALVDPGGAVPPPPLDFLFKKAMFTGKN